MNQGRRHIEVIYFDDIRDEVGNKLSYMGVYSGELNVPTAPVVLPKLCIAVKVITDFNDPLRELEVRIVKGDDEVELLTTGPIPMLEDTSCFDGNPARLGVRLTFMLAPFQIDEDSILRVKAKTEREELQAMALRIRVATPPEQPATPLS